MERWSEAMKLATLAEGEITLPLFCEALFLVQVPATGDRHNTVGRNPWSWFWSPLHIHRDFEAMETVKASHVTKEKGQGRTGVHLLEI